MESAWKGNSSMKRSYRNAHPPRWIIAKYASTCACKTPIKPGDRIMYFPASKTAECEACGLKTQGLLDDEDAMSSGGYR